MLSGMFINSLSIDGNLLVGMLVSN